MKESNFKPEAFEIVRKFISAESPEELERFTSILYAYGVQYKCVPYSESTEYSSFDKIDRVDIIMKYKRIEEEEIIKRLGVTKSNLYIYFN